MTSSVTRTTIESNAFGNIFELVDTRANIADPRDTENKKTRKFVYDSDPFVNSIDFGLLPYIIVELPTMEYSTNSLDGKYKHVFWRHKITIRTARHGASNSVTDIGRTDILSIADDLQDFFNSVTNRQTFSDLNMHKMNLTKLTTNTLTTGSKDIFQFEYNLEYFTRMAVSS